MKEVTEQGAYLQLASLCAKREHCEHDRTAKMRRWGLDDEAQARVMARLVGERYVDNERYARAFVHDKVHYDHWGRRKLEQALSLKGIRSDIRQRVLADVADEDYGAQLLPLLEKKHRQLSGDDPAKRYQKLVRYGLSRGFDYDLVKQCLATLGYR